MTLYGETVQVSNTHWPTLLTNLGNFRTRLAAAAILAGASVSRERIFDAIPCQKVSCRIDEVRNPVIISLFLFTRWQNRIFN